MRFLKNKNDIQLSDLLEDGFDSGAKFNLLYLTANIKGIKKKNITSAICFNSCNHFEAIVTFESGEILWIDNTYKELWFTKNDIISITTIDGFSEDIEIKLEDGTEFYIANQKRGQYKILANTKMIEKFIRIIKG